MPAPQASAMKELARTQFMSFSIQLPKDWKQPSGNPAAQQYVKSCKPDELVGVPGVPPLFVPATPNKYHTNTQTKLSDQFGKYIDGITSAICSAWSTWQSAAAMSGIIVNAVTATGGVVAGPPWTPLIMASGPKATPAELKYTTTIANVIGTAWLTYTATIKVPGLPWYPAFAAFPSAVAPPMPNVPTPYIALTQVPVSVSKSVLKAQMIAQHGDPDALHSKELFDCVADAFDKCFKIWQGSTQVTNVLGTGPIPTFAPPFVPVGPVVGGMATMTPGGFV